MCAVGSRRATLSRLDRSCRRELSCRVTEIASAAARFGAAFSRRAFAGATVGCTETSWRRWPVSDSRRLVDKLWSYCNVLRDDGVGDDRVHRAAHLPAVPEDGARAGDPAAEPAADRAGRLLVAAAARRRRRRARGRLHRTCSIGLAQQPGTLGTIFRKAQNRIQDPAKLKRLIVDLIDQENWSASGTDIKGDAYEELLAKGAEDISSGAGQYFTPRALIAGDGRLHPARPRRHGRRPGLRHRRLPAGRARARRPRTPSR